MGSVLALISKSEYAKLKTTGGYSTHKPGHVLKLDRYVSKNVALKALADDPNAALFLVTVLPGDALWLVAVLERPKHDRLGWMAVTNTLETLDLTPLCERLGLQRGDGKLGMRLQTPRPLEAERIAILRHVQAAMKAANNKVNFTAKAPKNIGKASSAKRAKTAVSKPAASKPAGMTREELARRAGKLKKGRFAFVNPRRYDGHAVLALDTLHQQQFIETMYAYAGDRAKTAQGALDAYLATQGWSRTDFGIELWDVIEGGKKRPRFEYWVQGAGDGQLFSFGMNTCPGWIGSTQHSFEAHGDEDEKTLALVDALQMASDRDL